MILEFIINGIKALIEGVISILPATSLDTPDLSWMSTPVQYLYLVFDRTALLAYITFIITFIGVQLLWNPTLFIIRKIRGSG